MMPERLHQPALDRVKRQPDIVAIGRRHFEAVLLWRTRERNEYADICPGC